MIIKPRVRGFLCVTTHPVGCETNVKHQIDYVKANGSLNNGPKKVLVIGASTGYGLASRITAAFGSEAATLGLFFEKEGLLKTFYIAITRSETRHLGLMVDLAYLYFDATIVKQRLQALITIEAGIVAQLPLRAALH